LLVNILWAETEINRLAYSKALARELLQTHIESGKITPMRLIGKWISQCLLVAAALLPGDWSLPDTLHLVQSDGSVRIMGFNIGPKLHAELTARIVLSALAIGLVAITDIWDTYLPRRALRHFRDEYLDLQKLSWQPLLGNDGVRVNVMYAKRL
jgi:hypothetical protein